MKNRRNLVLLALLSGAILCAVVAYDLWKDRKATIEAENAKTENLARVLDEHASQSLRRLDMLMSRAISETGRQGGPARADEKRLVAALRERLPTDGLVRGFVVMDGTGQIVASTLRTSAENLVTPRDAFAAFPKDRGEISMQFSGARKSPTSGNWNFHAARGIFSADGLFAGLIVAVVDLNYFKEFYRSIETGTNGFVSLFHRDGSLLMRAPFDEAIVARNWLQSPLFQEHLRAAERGTVRQVVVSTGIESLYSYRTVNGYPAIIAVGVSLTEALAAWEERALRDLLVLVLALGLLAWATRTVLKEQAAEDALRHSLEESQERFRQISENVRDVFWITDVEKHSVVYVSPAYETIWGRTCQSLYASPRDWLEAIHPDDRERMLQAAVSKQAQGTYDEEYRIVRPDGEERIIRDRAFPVRNREGAIFRIAGVARDITERHKVLLALRENERRMATLIQNLPGYVYRVNNDKAYTPEYISEGVQKITGYTQHEYLVDRTISCGAEIVEEDRDRVWDLVQKAVAADEAHECEYRIRTKTGEVKWMWERGSGVRDEQGNVVYLEGFVTDITSRRKAEQEREQIELQLRQMQKMEAIGTLAGGIAHDFNNMLAAILGNAEFARMDTGPTHPASESIGEIIEAAQRARALVQQILAFSRKSPGERRVLELQAEVERSARLLRATLPAGVDLQLDIKAAVPRVLADATQLQQVIVNLCTNAWQSIEERRAASDGEAGRIVIGLDAFDAGGDLIRTHPWLQPGRHARITVSDNGQGMDEATLERIFEPFFTTKSVGSGTGLGLSVVHGIVRAHGGAITVASQPGAGSTFAIYLPATQDAIPEPSATTSGTPARGSGQRILAVDDEAALLAITRRHLERLGYKVTAHTNPEEALAALRGDPAAFDLVLTDFNMPGMSGQKLAAEVACIRPDLPIVLASGFLDDGLREQLLRAGVRRILHKPYSMDELGPLVRNLLG